MKPKITETKEVWSVTSNTDLTEGRGQQIILHVCQEKATAIRLAKNKGVQGTNGYVEKAIAIKTDACQWWLIPGEIVRPSAEDTANQKASDEHEAIIQKAKDLGLSEDDIKVLRKNKQ